MERHGNVLADNSGQKETIVKYGSQIEIRWLLENGSGGEIWTKRAQACQCAISHQSGLPGITVPRDYGGIDVSAATPGEVSAILVEADSSIGQIPQNHFCILEALAGLRRRAV